MTSSPKKKSGIWFFILPILIIGVLIYSRNFSFSISSDTQFTPEEILSIMDNYSLNRIAGECTDKGFILFEYTETVQTKHTYNYFFVGKKPSRTQKTQISKAKETMKERVRFFADEGGFYYTLKDKERYLQFMDALIQKHNAKPYSTLKHPDFDARAKYYIINSTVVIDDAFDVNYDGWGIQFTTVQELERFAQQRINDSLSYIKQHEDSVNMAKQFVNSATDSSIAYVAINQAAIYNTADSHYEIMKIGKDTRLKIIRRTAYRLFCDFVADNGTPYSAWINEEDVIYKPANSDTETTTPASTAPSVNTEDYSN